MDAIDPVMGQIADFYWLFGCFSAVVSSDQAIAFSHAFAFNDIVVYEIVGVDL